MAKRQVPDPPATANGIAPAGKRQKTATDDTPAKTKRHRKIQPAYYEEIWQQIYLAGTEWAQLDDVAKIDWDFDHLDDAINEDGMLFKKNVYLFGATEPQLVMMDEKDTKGNVCPIPVIVAVVIDKPPSEFVALKSVQRTEEEIVPMKKLKMGWFTVEPDYKSRSDKSKLCVHVLKCEQRRSRLKNMSEAKVHEYDYVLPYIFVPDKQEEIVVDTEVQVMAELEGQAKPVVFEYDYEMDKDDMDEIVDTQIKDNDLDPKIHREPIVQAIEKQVEETKLRYKKEKEQRKARIEAVSEADIKAFSEMKLIKFYPQNDYPDTKECKVKYINRYYGKADEVL